MTLTPATMQAAGTLATSFYQGEQERKRAIGQAQADAWKNIGLAERQHAENASNFIARNLALALSQQASSAYPLAMNKA